MDDKEKQCGNCGAPLTGQRTKWCSDECYHAGERTRASSGGGLAAQVFSDDGFEVRMSTARKALRSAGFVEVYRRCGPATSDFLCFKAGSKSFVRVVVASKAKPVVPPIDLLLVVSRLSRPVAFYDVDGVVDGQGSLGLRIPRSSQGSRRPVIKVVDPVRDCLAAEWWPDGVPESSGSKFGMVVRDFKALGATPDEIVARRKVARSRWGEGMDTATGVLNQWAQLAPPPKRVVEPYVPDPTAKECFVCGSGRLWLWSPGYLEAACKEHVPDLKKKYPLGAKK